MIKFAKLFLFCDKNILLHLIEYYNENCVRYVKADRKYRMTIEDSWCAMFVSCIAEMSGKDPSLFPYEVSVNEQRLLAIERGLYFTDTRCVRVGDLILYDWDEQGIPDHIGVIASINGGMLGVIEGNKDNTVGIRNISRNSRQVLGFIKV